MGKHLSYHFTFLKGSWLHLPHDISSFITSSPTYIHNFTISYQHIYSEHPHTMSLLHNHNIISTQTIQSNIHSVTIPSSSSQFNFIKSPTSLNPNLNNVIIITITLKQSQYHNYTWDELHYNNINFNASNRKLFTTS